MNTTPFSLRNFVTDGDPIRSGRHAYHTRIQKSVKNPYKSTTCYHMPARHPTEFRSVFVTAASTGKVDVLGWQALKVTV